jgi:hypothetical protein
MALKRYPGNRFDGDTLVDRDSIPTSLPNGTSFLDLTTRNEYILNNGTWSLKGGGLITRGSFSTPQISYNLTLFEDNNYTSGDAYMPGLIVPNSYAENGVMIMGGKLTNQLTDIQRYAGVAVQTNGITVINSTDAYQHTTASQRSVRVFFGPGEIDYIFSGQSNLLLNGQNSPAKNYAFCIFDSLSGRPTGIYVDFRSPVGVWEVCSGMTGDNIFIGSVCKFGPFELPSYGSSGIRFRMNFPNLGGVTSKFREIGLWNSDLYPFANVHPWLHGQGNTFSNTNTFGATLIISGGINGVPSSGQVLTALDSNGQAVWRNPTVGTIYREYFTTGITISSGSTIIIPNSRFYETGTNKLHVYVSGLYKRINPSSNSGIYDYWEQSPSGVLFTKDIQPNSTIAFVIFN